MQSQPATRRWPITRHYVDEAHYTADAASLAATGWQFVSDRHDPNGAIIATWLAPAVAQPQVTPQPQPEAQPITQTEAQPQVAPQSQAAPPTATRPGFFRRLFGR